MILIFMFKRLSFQFQNPALRMRLFQQAMPVKVRLAVIASAARQSSLFSLAANDYKQLKIASLHSQ